MEITESTKSQKNARHVVSISKKTYLLPKLFHVIIQYVLFVLLACCFLCVGFYVGVFKKMIQCFSNRSA